MHYYEVAPTRIVRAGSRSFTYSSMEPLTIGQLVSIPVGSKELSGVVMSETTKPEYTTKAIVSILDATALPRPLIQLADWLSDYYATPYATVLQTLLPRGLDKTRRARAAQSKRGTRERTTIVFSDEQSAAIKKIEALNQGTVLLQGVTGSGKTEVYKEIARQEIAKGNSVIVLVPEISLTAQVIAEFSHDFPDSIITHSHMTEAQRHLAWLEALHSTTPRVVIGPRSALFLPLAKVGVIIIDEAHEPSYKQEQSPRYSALRTASVLGKLHGAKVILGSATPSITDRYLAELTKSPIITLTKPARIKAMAPDVELVDMTKRDNFTKHRFISDALIQSIDKNVARQKQTLIFHNRRGSASTTLCENCGWTANCPNCFVPLVLHGDTYILSCHICAYEERVPTHCPVCSATDIIHKGVGTKLIESELRKLFPKARIARFDSDNKNTETVDSLYDKLYKGEIDIAIGTQVVAKGLDLPHLRSVGVIQADSGLALPDFAAAERTFQLLSQVIGRVGRDEHATEVIVQSYQPTHPIITYGLRQDYEGFYHYGLQQRKRGHFPPFTYLLKLRTVYKSERAAIQAARTVATILRQHAHKDIQILGPTPAFYERAGDSYRWELTLKSPKREYLVAALQHVPSTHWQVELDPASLL